jgi:hypothetical protein
MEESYYLTQPNGTGYNSRMPIKPQTLDESQAAAQAIGKVAAKHEKPLPADLEAARA